MLRGKNAIVTGCNRGLGKAIVTKLIENGANVWCCIRKENKEFESYIQEWAERNRVWVKFVYFDLLDSVAINVGIRNILKEHLPVDILVNNAGVTHRANFQMTPISDLKQVYEINFFAPLQIMQMVSRAMLKQKRGVIVNIGSIRGLQSEPGTIAYGGSKAAVLWTTKLISRELASYGIRVNAVAPGVTVTDMTEGQPDDIKETLRSRIGMGHFGDAEDIANAVLYLVSDMAKFVTGEILCVDGGRF